MNRELVDNIARAVLYEGYILYPYRPSVKNAQRWTFGGLYPKSWSDAQSNTDPYFSQTECLIGGADSATVDITIRFLHLIDRTVGQLEAPIDGMAAESELKFHLVPLLEFAGQQYRPWQEAVERDVEAGTFRVSDLIRTPIETRFDFPSQRSIEALRDAQGPINAVLFRDQQQLIGSIRISATRLAEGLHKITVRTTNQTPLDAAEAKSRDDALMRSLISMHVILGTHGGDFVSLTDPPEKWAGSTQSCENIGTWPVLVGTGSEHDCILSSPIILYDYPQLAPESPGDLFDGTEIDEILTLRILTLTDEEKRSAAAVDYRTRQMLQRTESLARDQLASLHGTIRGMKPVAGLQAATIGSTS